MEDKNKVTEAELLADRLLVKRCLLGEEEAWKELIKRFKGLCFFLARRYNCQGIFDDVFAETLLWLLEKGLPEFDGQKTLSRVISRRFSDLLGSHLRAAKRYQLTEHYETMNPAEAASVVAEREETYAALRKAEEELSEEERKLLEDYYLSGITLEELARAQKVVASTVLRRIRKVLKKVETRLSEKSDN